jgi:type IX secretion system PorP/SprF family membrane protein
MTLKVGCIKAPLLSFVKQALSAFCLMKRQYTFLAIFCLLAVVANAQQYPLFTNYVTNAFGFNPAFAGLEQGGEARIVHRSQWTGVRLAPQTSLGSVHAKIKKFPFGIGGYVFNDVAGRLNRNGGMGVVTLHQALGTHTSFSFGVALGMSKIALDQDFNASDPNDQLLQQATKGDSKSEMNIGLLFRHRNFFLAASAPQFLEKKIEFTNIPDGASNSELRRHYFYMAGYRHYLGKMYLEPSVLYKTFTTAPNQFETSIKFGTGNPLWFAASFRHKAAGSIMAGIDLKNSLSFAYAYDLTAAGINKVSNSSHEITLGYRFLKAKDSDNDGVPDDEDKCPNEPGLRIKEGCPPEKEIQKKLDRDKDGIPDDEDECPTVFGVKENNGCPANDRDKDGITDDKDKCPDTYGLKQFDGCPMADRDNDGIRDDLDKCPDEAGPVSSQGCPTYKFDADGDGVPDADDECPNTPGLKENNGCPKPTMAEFDALNLAIENLYFDTDKWIIKPDSKPHLDKLAKLMASKRDWKVRVSGHADFRGTDEHNLMLSKNRAEAVMYYLMARGVKREQLVVEYYGETIPSTPGAKTEELSRNRRVEMEFIFN